MGLVPSHITINQLIEEYHKDAPNRLKESMLKGYSRIERNIISPTFGDRYIDQIATLEIQRWINNIFNNGLNGVKYRDETIKGILLHLSGLLTYAVKHDWLIKNLNKNLMKNQVKIITGKLTNLTNFWKVLRMDCIMIYMSFVFTLV